MIIISHRGNISGSNKKLENLPQHIQTLLASKVNVEIDVWFVNKSFYLGHDAPQYKVNKKFIIQKNLWCHAKNLDALYELLKLGVICFWHEADSFTLTSNNFIWTYPGKDIRKNSIIVDIASNWKSKNYKCAGVCVDYL